MAALPTNYRPELGLARATCQCRMGGDECPQRDLPAFRTLVELRVCNPCGDEEPPCDPTEHRTEWEVVPVAVMREPGLPDFGVWNDSTEQSRIFYRRLVPRAYDTWLYYQFYAPNCGLGTM